MRKVIELFLTAGLFGISALLDTRLFVELAGTEILAKGIFLALALLFAGCKVFLWIWGFSTGKKVAVAVAGILSLMSIFASFASALAIMTSAASQSELTQTSLGEIDSEIEALQTEIGALVEARDALPPDYMTLRERYEKLLLPKREALVTLRTQRASTRAELASVSTGASVYFLFDAVGRFFDPDEPRELGTRIRFVFTLIVAGLIELIAVVMSWFDTKEKRLAPSAEALRMIVVEGVTHFSSGPHTLCGRPSSDVVATKRDTRLCPSCSMKAALLRLQS